MQVHWPSNWSAPSLSVIPHDNHPQYEGGSEWKSVESSSSCDFDVSSGQKRARNRSWSYPEDVRLRQAVLMFGLDSWSLVASYVGNGRTRAQCSQRWFRGIDPTISRVKWTEEEVEKLLQLVSKYGTNQWVKVAREMQTRCDVQCRYRYAQIQKLQKQEEPRTVNKLPSIEHILGMDVKSAQMDLTHILGL